jgi:hypothetical protein
VAKAGESLGAQMGELSHIVGIVRLKWCREGTVPYSALLVRLSCRISQRDR